MGTRGTRMGCPGWDLGPDCRTCGRVWACVLPAAFSGPGLLFLSTLSIRSRVSGWKLYVWIQRLKAGLRSPAEPSWVRGGAGNLQQSAPESGAGQENLRAAAATCGASACITTFHPCSSSDLLLSPISILQIKSWDREIMSNATWLLNKRGRVWTSFCLTQKLLQSMEPAKVSPTLAWEATLRVCGSHHRAGLEAATRMVLSPGLPWLTAPSMSLRRSPPKTPSK